MSEKETVYVFRTNSSLRQANYDTAAAIKQEPLASNFDKNGRAESLSIWKGRSRTEQCDSHLVGARGARSVVYHEQ